MTTTWEPKIGDAVLAVSKGTGGLDTFTEFYPARVIKIHRGGGRRYPRYKVDLRYSNNGSVEREIPVFSRRVQMVRVDTSEGRGDTDWEEDTLDESTPTPQATTAVRAGPGAADAAAATTVDQSAENEVVPDDVTSTSPSSSPLSPTPPDGPRRQQPRRRRRPRSDPVAPPEGVVQCDDCLVRHELVEAVNTSHDQHLPWCARFQDDKQWDGDASFDYQACTYRTNFLCVSNSLITHCCQHSPNSTPRIRRQGRWFPPSKPD